jgi:hypothetical protein
VLSGKCDYAPDELAEALTLAADDPDAWLRLVEHNEAKLR